MSLCLPKSSRALSSYRASPQLAISISLFVIAARADAASIASCCPYVRRKAAAAKAVLGVFKFAGFLAEATALRSSFSLAASFSDTSKGAPKSTRSSAVFPATAISSSNVSVFCAVVS